VGSRRLVLPVMLDDDVPLEMFSGSPLLQRAATKILDSLSDPSAQAAISLARTRLQKIAEDRAVASLRNSPVYLLHTEFALRDPKTRRAEKFSQSGTGFLIDAEGKVLTAKRVIEPWKFDPSLALLIARHHLKLDPGSVRICAWAARASVLSSEGEPDCANALSTAKRTLQVVKKAPDRMEKREFMDPDTGERATVPVHVAGENDLAILKVAGENTPPLALADPGLQPGADVKTALVGYPFGLSRRQAVPQPVLVKVARIGALYRLKRRIEPGEAGAPLVTLDGKVLAIAGGADECIPIDAARPLVQ
ncbi:MAG: S1 family peptidase, partial [Gammaproteobacteria bacterium]